MTIHPGGPESFHAGGRADEQTNTTKLTVAFRNSSNVPKHKLIGKHELWRKLSSFKPRSEENKTAKSEVLTAELLKTEEF
jgi:hypothetical protein